jgi:hypothetical protein
MGQSSQDLEQRLLQISVDLSSQLAEIQRLRMAIEAAEASRPRKHQTARRRRAKVIALSDRHARLRKTRPHTGRQLIECPQLALELGRSGA